VHVVEGARENQHTPGYDEGWILVSSQATVFC